MKRENHYYSLSYKRIDADGEFNFQLYNTFAEAEEAAKPAENWIAIIKEVETKIIKVIREKVKE